MNGKDKPLGWIPNVDGFEFMGRLASGELVRCRVIQKADGLHTVEGGMFPLLTGWVDVPTAAVVKGKRAK